MFLVDTEGRIIPDEEIKEDPSPPSTRYRKWGWKATWSR